MRLSSILTLILLTTFGPIHAVSQTPGHPISLPNTSKLANTQWNLASFKTEGAESPVIEGTTITLKFGVDGRATGSGGCNSYAGGYNEAVDKLSFSQIISTKRACLAQNANQQEQQYLAALETAGKFEISENRLTIYYGDGMRQSLNFVAECPAKVTDPV
jgi:heat shock protein HslJ